jgi:hypothetical protein
MSHAMQLVVVGVALAALLPGRSVAAEEESAAAASSSATPLLAQVELKVVAAPARANPLGLKPLDQNVLAKRRGGTDGLSDMQLKGVVSDNRAVNVVTGNNIISDGAFQGTTGLPMVVQNSGNNVLIQNATIVNVQVK